MNRPEYGWRGRVGVIVPPANVTVEPELIDILPRGVSLLGTRLPGRVVEETSVGLRERFVEYNRRLAEIADSFGGARLSAVGLACTGSCYLDGPDGEERLLADLGAGGAPHVITAARAVRRLLASLGCCRIGLVSPYPEWLTELATAYWRACGLDIVRVIALPDVVSIYAVDTGKVVTAVEEMKSADADAILISGTGVPTLPAIAQLAKTMPVPVISSNLSLGWWVLQTLGIDLSEAPSPAVHALRQWLPQSHA